VTKIGSIVGGAKLGAGGVVAVQIVSVIVTGVSLGYASVILYPPEPSGPPPSDRATAIAPPAPTATATATATSSANANPAATATPTTSASQTPLALRTDPPAAPAASSAGHEADSEVQLLQSAQEALRDNDPDDALALAAKHARRFPNGFLAQEREVIAIEALMKKNRTAEARARAAAFAQKYPHSGHQRRIDVLVSGGGDQNP
jgi:hypothetical protein